MEFSATLPSIQSKNLYPCLASITIAPPGADSRASRRLSTGSADESAVDTGEGDNIIKRVISGGRRKSSFGTGTGNDGAGAGGGPGAASRRLSIAPSAMGQGGVMQGSNATGPEGVQQGTWFWRVQAGVVDNNLLLLPISLPANPLLTSPPAPLSTAMPAHHTSNKSNATSGEGMMDKVKDLFRRGSTNTKDTAHVEMDGPDRIVDQSATGDQLPSARGNAAGAINANANAETGWPGVINGQKLQAVYVPLSQIEKGRLKVTGGKRGEASWVTVPVTSHFAHMIQGHADGAGAPKSGVVRLEFDKDWIGSKGEAELLHHHITQALSNRSPQQPPQVQLGHSQGGMGMGTGMGNSNSNSNSNTQAGMVSGMPSGQGAYDPQSAGSGALQHPEQGGHTLSQALGYTPDESVASGRKVAG